MDESIGKKFYIVAYSTPHDTPGYFKNKITEFIADEKIVLVIRGCYIVREEFISEFLEFLSKYVEIKLCVPVYLEECMADQYSIIETSDMYFTYIDHFIQTLKNIKEGKITGEDAEKILQKLSEKGMIATIIYQARASGCSEKKIDEFKELAFELTSNIRKEKSVEIDEEDKDEVVEIMRRFIES